MNMVVIKNNMRPHQLAISSLSIMNVTGPSFSNVTFIMAPNTPSFRIRGGTLRGGANHEDLLSHLDSIRRVLVAYTLDERCIKIPCLP